MGRGPGPRRQRIGDTLLRTRNGSLGTLRSTISLRRKPSNGGRTTADIPALHSLSSLSGWGGLGPRRTSGISLVVCNLSQLNVPEVCLRRPFAAVLGLEIRRLVHLVDLFQ